MIAYYWPVGVGHLMREYVLGDELTNTDLLNIPVVYQFESKATVVIDGIAPCRIAVTAPEGGEHLILVHTINSDKPCLKRTDIESK